MTTPILDRLQQSVNQTETTLLNLDRALAHLRGRTLPAVWVAELVDVLTNGQALTWALGQRAWRPNAAARYAAIIHADGVRVWRCDERGHLDYYLGLIHAQTTRADVWRMRQQFGWRRAFEAGMVTR